MITCSDYNVHLYEILIDELETQISLIKQENQQFYEDIDMLNDAAFHSEEKNKVSGSLN
jgi:hypothetical protein